MSKKNLDPKQVEEFLLLNPDFLSSNSHILNSIEIVHETGGAVSLIQKQVKCLDGIMNLHLATYYNYLILQKTMKESSKKQKS